MNRLRTALICAVVAISASATMLLGSTSCALTSLPSDEVCKDVGYSIANRVLSCTQDDARSKELYADFQRRYLCRVFEQDQREIESYYQCPVAVREVPCAQVIAYGDDLDDWLAPLPYCGKILEHADETPIPSVPDAGADAPDMLDAADLTDANEGADVGEGSLP